jgi:hypothetical protein
MRNYRDACLVREDSEGEEEVLILARFQGLISSSHLQGLAHRHWHCWTLEIFQMCSMRFKR